MLSYSPYDNVAAQDYPAHVRDDRALGQPGAVFRAGQVGREAAPPEDRFDRLLVMRINMEAGHGGKSGRFEHLRELAEEYAFVISESLTPGA